MSGRLTETSMGVSVNAQSRTSDYVTALYRCHNSSDVISIGSSTLSLCILTESFKS